MIHDNTELDNLSSYIDDIKSYYRERHKALYTNKDFSNNIEYDKIINSRNCKSYRIKKRLLYLISHRKNVYFITFTFDDTEIKKCDRSKLDSIKNCLKSFSNDILIMMNRDFGSKNDREHFHCIVGTDSDTDIISHVNSSYKSRSNVKKVYKNSKDVKCLSKYINKLTNHCIKDTTHRFRMYYNFKGYDNLDPIYYLNACFKYGLK